MPNVDCATFGAQQFSTVHSVRISNDDVVYVADRVNYRVRVFRLDGAFVKDQFIRLKTRGQRHRLRFRVVA